MKYLLIVITLLLGGIYGVYYYQPSRSEQGQMDTALWTITPVEAQETKPTESDVLREIAEVFRPEGKGVVVRAINIAFCESGLREDAKNFNSNKTWDSGLFQINDVNKPTETEKEDYRANIRKAYKIYLGRGRNFSAWVCDRKI